MYAITYWVFIFLIVFIELGRVKRSRVDFLTIFGFYFLLSYLIPCALWSTFPELYSASLPYALYYNAAMTEEVLVSVSIAFTGFYLFYALFSSFKRPFYINVLPFGTGVGWFYKIGFIFFLFSSLVVLGVVITGGVKEFISAGVEARHNHTGFGIVGYFRYFYSAFPFIFIGIALFLSCRKRLGVSWVYAPFLFLVFLIGTVALVSNGGRGALVGAFINALFFLYMIGFYRISLKYALISFVVLFFSLFVIFELHHISAALMRGDDVFLIARIFDFVPRLFEAFFSIFQYFSHYIFIIVEASSAPDVYSYPRLGSDNLHSLIIAVPGMDGTNVGLPELPDTISQDVMGKHNGAIPPGWMGWALINGGYFWLLIKVFYSSAIAAIIDGSKDYIVRSCGYFLGSYIYFILLLMVFNFLFSATAASMVRGNVGVFVYFLALLFFPFVRVGRLKLIKGRG